MVTQAIRTGVCPYRDYPRYKKDLEQNGYKVLGCSEQNEEGETVVVFTYIKVHNAARTMFSQ
jgi:hypothetical protein